MSERIHRVSIAGRERPAFVTIDSPGIAPIPCDPSGRKPKISDGFHSKADFEAGRAPRQHRGADWMYGRKLSPTFLHPWQTRGHEIPQGVQTPALATWRGTVIAAGIIDTGGVVWLHHGGGLATGYHHLRGLLVGDRRLISERPYLTAATAEDRGPCEFGVGDVVEQGYPVGIVGGSPVGHGTVHCHRDLAIETNVGKSTLKRGRLAGTFIDEAPYAKRWRVLTFEEAWASVGRVG